MSVERISRLHEQASEHYLNGDYAAALASWNEVLAIDPSNEAALEGARMAVQFAEEQAPAPTAAPAALDLERDLDQGLKVLDSLGGKVSAPLSFDLGDPSQVDSAPIAAAAEEGWEPTPREDVSYGLAPAGAPTVSASGVPTPAAVELKRRVDDLLVQARTKAQTGERDEALAILARVTILDEDNAEAESIRTELETAGNSDLQRIEQAIIEGVSALESGRLDEAERLFQEALALAPEHREALHYLEQTRARRQEPAAAPAVEEDLLADAGAFGDVADPAGPVSPPEVKAVPIAKSRPSRSLPPSVPEVQRPGKRGGSLPSAKAVAGVGLVAVVAVAAWMIVPGLLGGSGSPAESAPPPRAAAPPRTTPPASAAPTAAPMGDALRVASVAQSVARGKQLAASGDFAGAVVAYNEAIKLDPANLDARAGLAAAGSRYKEQKADEDAVKAIRSAFHDGEYASGLRLAYRLPATVEASQVESIKVAGWYNLAIVALRAGDCRSALGNVDEVLALAPDDEGARKLKEFAVRYQDVEKDRAFLDTVEALPFRSLP